MMRRIACVLAVSLAVSLVRADRVELLNGVRVEGRIVSQTDDQVVIEATMGGGKARMRFPMDKVHALTAGGVRKVIQEKGSAPPPSKPTPSQPKAAEPETTAGRVTRSRSEVEALIQKAGATPPDWWDSVPLEYPKSLDLSWPDKPPGGWNANRNVGQYLWSVINENPSRWKSGVRFLHYLLTVHKDDPQKLTKVMGTLGGKYFDLLDDPARAAFWYRKAHERTQPHVNGIVRLAECYWKLGGKSMALAELKKASRYVTPGMIKLHSDMGDLTEAIRLAKMLSRAGYSLQAYMAAAEAYRCHSRNRDAITYYEKVLAVPATGKEANYINKVKERARSSIEAIKLFDALDLGRIADGTYRGGSVSYAGPLSVEVTVAAGRIEKVRVTHYQDKQYFTSLTEIPKRIVERQSLKGIDAITGATITSVAIVNATAKALASGMK